MSRGHARKMYIHRLHSFFSSAKVNKEKLARLFLFGGVQEVEDAVMLVCLETRVSLSSLGCTEFTR